jgi:acyl carrier protein
MSAFAVIENKLIEIINDFIPVDNHINSQTAYEARNKCLHIIISNSEHAILFISTLEDEFEIEISDEDLTLDNMLSYEKIKQLLVLYSDDKK